MPAESRQPGHNDTLDRRDFTLDDAYDDTPILCSEHGGYVEPELIVVKTKAGTVCVDCAHLLLSPSAFRELIGVDPA